MFDREERLRDSLPFYVAKSIKSSHLFFLWHLTTEALNASFSRIWQKAVTVGIPTEEDCQPMITGWVSAQLK